MHFGREVTLNAEKMTTEREGRRAELLLKTVAKSGGKKGFALYWKDEFGKGFSLHTAVNRSLRW